MNKYIRALLNVHLIRRMRWIAYKRLRGSLPTIARYFRPRFADVDGLNTLWFNFYGVERRAGGGYIVVGDDSRIEGSLICHQANSRLIIGSRTSIGGGTVIESLQEVVIGDDCLISHHVTIQDHDSHPMEWSYRQHDVIDWIEGRKDWAHVKHAAVVIEPKCWIGTRCIILKGVRLGEGSIVAAGSVVTKSCPPYTLLAGNPARVMRSLLVPADNNTPNPVGANT